MDTTQTTAPKMMHLGNAYAMRETLSAIGGRYDAARKEWVLTAEQYDRLWEMVEASGERVNKRDRALWTAYQACTDEWR